MVPGLYGSTVGLGGAASVWGSDARGDLLVNTYGQVVVDSTFPLADGPDALVHAARRAVIDGDVESGSVMAGQSVGMVTREEPVAEIIKELADEAAAALESRG